MLEKSINRYFVLPKTTLIVSDTGLDKQDRVIGLCILRSKSDNASEASEIKKKIKRFFMINIYHKQVARELFHGKRCLNELSSLFCVFLHKF